MLLLGHRGAPLHAPENTHRAFELALQHGCDGVEFDVRCTADGRAVLCHDTHVAGVHVERTPYQELYDRAGLPTLEETLAAFSGRAWLDIELKVSGLEAATLAALDAHPPALGYIVSSFVPAVVMRLRALRPSLNIGWIVSSRFHVVHWRKLPIDALIPQRKLATPELLREVIGEGKRVYVWTVNQAEEMERLAEAGVDGIISDQTELLVHTLGGQRGLR